MIQRVIKTTPGLIRFDIAVMCKNLNFILDVFSTIWATSEQSKTLEAGKDDPALPKKCNQETPDSKEKDP